MRIIRWLSARFTSPKSPGPIERFYALAQAAHAELQLQHYDRARAHLLEAMALRAD